MAFVQNICKLSQVAFSNRSLLKSSNDHEVEKNLRKVLNAFSKITFNDLHLDHVELAGVNSFAPVSYTSIFQNDVFSLTVFGFRHKSSMIPLHDHPGMHGFIKCVQGSLSVESYNLLNQDVKIPNEILRKVFPSKHRNIVPAVFVGESITSTDDGQVLTLTPNSRNIHSVKPISNHMAVMVDLITPPYTNETTYYYYKVIDTIYDNDSKQSITWLLKDVDTLGFFCDTIRYRGPSIHV